MSKTTPVRWWRDDATRYQKRGPHDEQWGGPGKWGNGYAADIRAEDEWQERQHGCPWLRLALPADERSAVPSDPWGTQALRDGRSAADPIADVKAYLADKRREIEQMNKEHK